MSLFKEIKDAGLDIFIQYHPKVIEFKREARKLQKESSITGKKSKSLMQCYEEIAKKNGFNNWHHFMALIKKHYNYEEPEIYKRNDYFIITKTLEEKPEESMLCLGHDVNFNNYKWQNESSLNRHQIILTKNYQEYNIFLMKQIIAKQKNLIVINPNRKSVDELIESAKNNQREKEIKIINYSSEVFDKEYISHINDSWEINPHHLVEILAHLYDIKEHVTMIEKSEMITLLLHIILIISYLSQESNEKLTIDFLKNHIEINTLIKLCNEKTLPEQLQVSLKIIVERFNGLPTDTDQEKEKKNKFYQKLKNDLINILCICEYENIYKKDGLHWDNLLNNNDKRILIFYFGDIAEKNKKEQSLLIINMIKYNIWNQLTSSNIKTQYPIRESQYLFMINAYLPKAIMIMPAQAKSVRLSINTSYPDKETMIKTIEDKENVESIFANALTKICSLEEKEKLNLFSIDISEQITSNEKIAKNEDILWVIKAKDECQIEFKNMNV